MRAALEAVAHFLGKYGAVDEATGIMKAMARMGYEVPEEGPLRYSVLIGALRKELEDEEEPLDYVVLFERLIQLYPTIPNALCRALSSSPLLLHVLVERFEVTFAGISAERFRKEREDLGHVDGVYNICLLILDKLFPGRSTSNALGAFLEAFTDVFHDTEDPKSRWTELYNKHRINDAAFRRDMMRALRVIESAAIGDTAIERAFPTDDSDNDGPMKIAPRQLLKRKFEQANNSSELWADLSVIHSIHLTEESRAQSSTDEDANEQQQCARLEEEQGVWTTTVPRTDGDTTTNSEDEEPPRPRQTRRVRTNAPAAEAEPAASADADDASDVASSSASVSGRGGRRKRKRWSSEEVQALLDGYAEFGEEPNVWVLIKGKYADVLRERSNVDLKDKYRNLQKFGKIPRVD